jgi:nucleoside-diphosphate-sugar epimerase
MRILIIGSSGFIGTNLASIALDHKIEVVTLSRKSKSSSFLERNYAWMLGQDVPKVALSKIDCAIHLAYDYDGLEGSNLTLKSIQAIARQLEEEGISRQLFFSSYTSWEGTSSLYGRTKYAIEKAIEHIPGVIIVRPGLVIGKGGLYGRILKWAKILPVIPLPDGGRGIVPVIDIQKLCILTLDLASTDLPLKEVNLFELEFKSLRQLVLEAAQPKRKPWILPIPNRLLSMTLFFTDLVRIRLPVNADNLAGFISNQSATHKSSLTKVK